MKEATSEFTDWSAYREDADIKEATDLYFQELSRLLEEKTSISPVAYSHIEKGEAKPQQSEPKAGHASSGQKHRKSPKKQTKDPEIKQVELLGEDVKYIKSFIALHNKRKTSKAIRNLLIRLQKAITQKLINKKSPFAGEIDQIQTKLIRLVKAAGKAEAVDIVIESALLNKLVSIAGGEKVYGSISYLKRYLGMQGQPVEIEKANNFIIQAEKAIKSGKVGQDDPYLDRLQIAVKTIRKALTGKAKAVEIMKAELHGLQGILNACECGLQGIEEENNSTSEVINSLDFVKLQFKTLGFTGKWKDFIGDPPAGFTAMISGKPKFGKSYLCIDFAGYLARHHGRVLYVAKEEEFNVTLQDKVIEKEVQHSNLDISADLISDLSSYDFVFLDSVTRLGFSPEDLARLEKTYPQCSFVYIFHVRKDGRFKGRSDFQHDVDIVIEVPEKGSAIQFGRFNQGGTMEIFDDHSQVQESNH